MKIVKSFGILFLVLTGIMPVAHGDSYRTDINPALLYYRAFIMATEPVSDAKVMTGFRESGIVQSMESIGDTNFWPQLMAKSGGTSAGIIKLLRDTESLFPRFAQLMALPPTEYEAQYKDLTPCLPIHVSIVSERGHSCPSLQLRTFGARTFRSSLILASTIEPPHVMRQFDPRSAEPRSVSNM